MRKEREKKGREGERKGEREEKKEGGGRQAVY